MHLDALIKSSRPPFLLLAPVCVTLGLSAAARGNEIDPVKAALCLLAALLALISINALNEYQDFQSGLDLDTERTPFSGGSGALPQQPAAATAVLTLALGSSVFTGLIGLYLVLQTGPLLLPMGLLGLLLIWTYTRQLNRYPWLCLLAPGLGVGGLMVLGSSYVVSGRFTPAALWASLLTFFLLNNLLLLNQYPDMAADRQAGRRHLLITYGIRTANRVYLLQWLLALSALLIAVVLEAFPVAALWVLLPLSLGLFAWSGARRFGMDIGRQLVFMASGVGASLLSPLVLALCLFLGK